MEAQIKAEEEEDEEDRRNTRDLNHTEQDLTTDRALGTDFEKPNAPAPAPLLESRKGELKSKELLN